MHFILFQVWLRVHAGVGVEGENIKEGYYSREGYMQKTKGKGGSGRAVGQSTGRGYMKMGGKENGREKSRTQRKY